MLEFAVLFFISHRSRTSGAFLDRLYNSVLELGLEVNIEELLSVINFFIDQKMIFEIGDGSSSEGRRLFFIEKKGRQQLEESKDFSSNLEKLKLARTEYLNKTSK